MRPERFDLAVFARDYPETRLVVEVKWAVGSPTENDAAVQQVVRAMWGANCHFGLVFTTTQTFVLRDDFSRAGPESIRVTDVLPTATVLSRLGRPLTGVANGREFEDLVRDWLERLAASYESALPDDPAVIRAFFPDIVGAVADGRVVSEVAA